MVVGAFIVLGVSSLTGTRTTRDLPEAREPTARRLHEASEPTANKDAKGKEEAGRKGTPDKLRGRDSLVGTWDYVPSAAQVQFAREMGDTAGPMTYTFDPDGTYTSVGGPLGRNVPQEGWWAFDGRKLSLHRKGVGGRKAIVYERTTHAAVSWESDGTILVVEEGFDNWIVAGDEIRFRKR